MVLTVDVGNSDITFGGFVDRALVFKGRISTDTRATEDEYASRILSLLALYGIESTEMEGAIVASVVPPLNAVMKRALHFLFDIEPLVVGPGIKTGIGIRCDAPSSVGADLICAAVAAHTLYGSPSLIIDVGTATKMTVVDASGAFIGTSIAPGVLMGLNALADGTAQLPRVSLEAPVSVVAKNTADCMKSGVIFGHSAMIDGMIDRVREELAQDIPAYITGGLAEAVMPYCRREMTFDENLVLKGLYILYEKNR